LGRSKRRNSEASSKAIAMVHPIGDFEAFCRQLESLKGKFPLYQLDEVWVENLLKTLADS
jgi:hypothetical protein